MTEEQAEETIQSAVSAKQDKLTGLPGQAVGFDSSGAAAAVRGWSNFNLLDNWYFPDPINQRGQEEYTESAAYSIDHFLVRGPVKVQLGNDALMISRNNISLGGIVQGIEDGITRLAGKTVTLSVLVDGLPAGAFELFLGSSNSIVNAGTTYGLIMVNTPGLSTTTVTLPDIFPGSCLAAHFWLLSEPFGGTIGACKIRAMKLELGTQQTLAHQDADGNWVLNDPPPDRALELTKCQRFQIMLASASSSINICFAKAYSSTVAYGIYYLPEQMRETPTAIINDASCFVLSLDSGDSVPCEKMEVASVYSNTLEIKITAKNLTSGGVYRLKSINKLSSILLDANL